MAMLHSFNKRLVIVAVLAVGHWSTANATSSFKVAQPPSDAQQAPTLGAGSSFKLVSPAPDVRQAQGAPAAPVGASPGSETGLTSESSVVPQQILLRPDGARLVTFAEPFSSIHVANPTVVDATPVTDHSIILKAFKEGYSDIYFVRKDGDLSCNLQVRVDNFVSTRGPSVPDPAASSLGSIEMHNKAKLNSQTNFRCGPHSCYYTGEITVSEPAPLPSGYQKQEIEQKIDQTNRNAPVEPTH